MAKATLQVARQEYKCGKSGRTIKVGEKYWKAKFRFSRSPMIRAYEYPFSGADLTQSEYKRSVYRIIDLADNFSGKVPSDLQDLRDDLISEIEALRDELDEKLENMPEGLRDTSSSGMILQERIDNLQSALDDLEYLDDEDFEDFSTDYAKSLYEEYKDEFNREYGMNWDGEDGSPIDAPEDFDDLTPDQLDDWEEFIEQKADDENDEKYTETYEKIVDAISCIEE